MNTNKPPQLVSVCTDMLNINLQLNEKNKALVTDNIKQMSSECGIPILYKYGYKQVLPLLKEDQTKTILFCTDNKYPNRSFIHLQLNPSELDKALSKSLRADLDWLLGPIYEEFFSYSNVARLDIAADFLNLNIDDFMFHNSRQRRSAMFFNQRGETETIYLGHSKSKFQMRIYNKTAKRRPNSDSSTNEQVTRLEATINPNCSLKDINKINNPFEGIMIFKLSDLIADERLPHSFSDSLHYRGLTATLKLLTADEHKAVKDLIKDHVYRDFPADKIFAEWIESLKKLTPLKAH